MGKYRSIKNMKKVVNKHGGVRYRNLLTLMENRDIGFLRNVKWEEDRYAVIRQLEDSTNGMHVFKVFELNTRTNVVHKVTYIGKKENPLFKGWTSVK